MDQLLSFTDSTLNYETMEGYKNDINKKSSESGTVNNLNPPKEADLSDFEDVQIIEGDADENKRVDKVDKDTAETKKCKKSSENTNKSNDKNPSDETLNAKGSSNASCKVVSITDNTSTSSSSSSASTAVMNVHLGTDNIDHGQNININQNDSNQTNSVIVIDDSGSDDELQSPNPRLYIEPIKTAVETLNLTLEEAFFLSFGLGCLQVVDLQGIFLSLRGMWHLYKESQTDFISSYVTYHYFRSKGWIVKPGAKFGGNFCKLLIFN